MPQKGRLMGRSAPYFSFSGRKESLMPCVTLKRSVSSEDSFSSAEIDKDGGVPCTHPIALNSMSEVSLLTAVVQFVIVIQSNSRSSEMIGREVTS